jgi:hypothetical protein
MRNRPMLAALAVLLAASAAASCGSDRVESRAICDYALDAGTFIGPVVGIQGRAVTFRVESVQPNKMAEARNLPHPEKGRVVSVRYEAHEERFLHVDERYRVKVWPIHGYFSSVHTADRPCSGGTAHADGEPIET